MDELLQHCMRELSFDGDLGCDVSRLRHFIQGFYSSQSSPGNQNVDETFHAFVWSLLIQQPSVRVGLVPEGGIEVYIAPQLSKKKKVTKSKKKQLVPEPIPFPAVDGHDAATNDGNSDSFPGRLRLIEEATVYSLDQLIQRHGNGLRVAVDPETSFRAVSGSHARPAKLSPMVYTALQLISRGREAGLSVVDLGKKTGYDQKTCFYLVKQLLELDLVVKLGKGGPGGGNFCIHKYFYSRSTFWEGVRREAAANVEEAKDESNGNDTSADTRSKLQFDPIDSRHLASTQLLKTRLARLLKNSENGLHVYQNLIVTIGFVNPTRRDRRFFIIRIRELIKERFIEKVIVPNKQGATRTLCIRLVEDHRASDAEGIVVQPVDVGDEEQEAEASEDRDNDMPAMNLTIHRQMVKLLEEAGSEGLTLHNISARLGMFDRRTVDLLMYRLERYPPPTHLADLAICDFIENEGRERRHRYYTLPGFLSFIHEEKIDHTERTDQYTSRDLSQTGGFCSLPNNLFYSNQAAVVKYEDEYRNRVKPPKDGVTRKIGRPRKEGTKPRKKKSTTEEGHADSSSVPRGKRGEATKTAIEEDRDDAQQATEKSRHRGLKRKRNAADDKGDDLQPGPKKKRGRQPNNSDQKKNDLPSGMSVHVIPASSPPENNEMQGRTSQDEKAGGQSNRMPMTGPFGGASPSGQTMSPYASTVALGDGVDTFTGLPHPSSIPLSQNVDIPTEAVSSAMQGTPVPLEVVPEGIPSSLDICTSPPPENSGLIVSPRGPSNPVTNAFEQSSLPPDASDSVAGSKRNRDDTHEGVKSLEEPQTKRPKTSRPTRSALVNISHLRAENEIIRVVEESGGIVNVSSKEFSETYGRVISRMAEAGEATSMPVGTQPDRRTIRKLIERLVDRGRLKTLTVTLAPRVSQIRPVKLVYDSEVAQERLDQYLSALKEDIPVLNLPVHKELHQPVVYTRPEPRRARDLVLTRGGLLGGNKNERWRRGRVLGNDENVIRKTILSEGQTVAQFYGYLVGRVRRARELHQFTLAHLESSNISPSVVSRTERVIAFPYYYQDLPVSTYFTLISATEYSTALSTLMETPGGRQTLVKDLPPDMHDELKIGRARARDKLLTLLTILASLKLVTPLRPSTTNAPYLTCDPKGTHPTQFDAALATGGKYSGSAAPQYWRFNTIAPIHFYSVTSSWPPPFHRDMFVRTADESMPFWLELEDVCLNKEYVDPTTSLDSITGPCACTPALARGLRRGHAWVSSYVLSWNQKEYLNRWVDPSTGYTPMSDPDGGLGRLEYICQVISAPVNAVQEFFTASRNVFRFYSERVREKEQRRREEAQERQATEARALLAKKAGEARQQLEADWEALVSRVHPTPLPYGSGTRLKALRTRYLQSRAGMVAQKWEAAVLEALSGPKAGKRNPVLLPTVSSIFRKPNLRGGFKTLPPVAASQQKSVKDLIERYREKVASVRSAPQKKMKPKELSGNPGDTGAIPTGPQRRQRFQWTPEYDELARDISAILRSRCRTWHRMDWTGLEQVFPFLPRNNVRQRLTTLRQEAGGESYLNLLEEKWHELWLDHRGTEALPDDNPNDPTEFDAIAHVEFLRKYIDKRALRVGLPEDPVDDAAGVVLTSQVSDFISRWDVVEKTKASNKMDFLWSPIGDEHREKTFLGEAFSITQNLTSTPTYSDPRSNGVAESALKMALATAGEDYDANDASTLLNDVGREPIRQASEELLARGVISESGRRHRKRPGRNLKISALNEDALGGSFHSDVFLEACAVEDIFEDETCGWRMWSTVATEGEMAGLIELVSLGKVEFQIDVSGPAAQRQQIDWNSKKVDDDQIETVVTMRRHHSVANLAGFSERRPVSPALAPVGMAVDEPSFVEHGQNHEGPAPCRQTSEGIITCQACVNTDQKAFLAQVEFESRNLCLAIIEKLDNAGSRGLSFETLASSLVGSTFKWHHIQAITNRLTSGMEPVCYWVGYTHAVLVSRRHIREWTVSIPGPTLGLVFPRRWLNVKAAKMEGIWNAGLRAVVGVLVLRPGIPQAELRQKLMSVYDRQELNELLYCLWVDGLIANRVTPKISALTSTDIRAIHGVEEQNVCWTLKENAWYRVHESRVYD